MCVCVCVCVATLHVYQFKFYCVVAVYFVRFIASCLLYSWSSERGEGRLQCCKQRLILHEYLTQFCSFMEKFAVVVGMNTDHSYEKNVTFQRLGLCITREFLWKRKLSSERTKQHLSHVMF